ncbi:hypothetical protein [Plantactinospora sp. KBS50]|uniref:hypothetical protein n=1 Tax=Plantactinospora sp. KBS50 TaxID=2024580 RepID=UPI000BAAB1E8|nr:hypothetical protein [Plantactinospora sp. KBS50]ASW54105.1 hypothetical protein CIK06_07740 [Plantactinospora sp. KBS50]
MRARTSLCAAPLRPLILLVLTVLGATAVHGAASCAVPAGPVAAAPASVSAAIHALPATVAAAGRGDRHRPGWRLDPVEGSAAQPQHPPMASDPGAGLDPASGEPQHAPAGVCAERRPPPLAAERSGHGPAADRLPSSRPVRRDGSRAPPL